MQVFMEWANMGGHGFYIWLSYGVFAAVIAGNVVMALRERKKIRKILS